MKRIKITPRKDYKQKIEALGFDFHENYWNEDAYYSFTAKEIGLIEGATEEVYRMYCDAVQYILDNRLLGQFMIPRCMWEAIEQSWNNDDLSLLGRFDFFYSLGEIKVLEFNADTPTSLLEASLVQWFWKEDMFPEADQFNSIHEALVQSWADIHNSYSFEKYHFMCGTENNEDLGNVRYLMSTALEANLSVVESDLDQFKFDRELNSFFDQYDEKVDCCFKLYPWEWMMNESSDGCKADITWIEPMWKSIMSNKAILPILYRLFPDSPYLLKADTKPFGNTYCKKPAYSREGANIELVKDGRVLECTGGDYGEEGYIYQELVELPEIDGKYPIIGSWVIGGEPAGIGVREANTRITDNLSNFKPHVIK